MKESNFKKNEENIKLKIKEVRDKIEKANNLLNTVSDNQDFLILLELAKVHWIFTQGYSKKFNIEGYLDTMKVRNKGQILQINAGIEKHKAQLTALNKQLEHGSFIIKIIKERDLTFDELKMCKHEEYKGKYIYISTEREKDDYAIESKNLKLIYIYKNLHSKSKKTDRTWMIDAGGDRFFKPIPMGNNIEDNLIKEYILNKYK